MRRTSATRTTTTRTSDVDELEDELSDFFSACLASFLSAPDSAEAADLAVALGGAVVGVVEAGALEMHRDGVEDALHGRAADLALGHGTVGHLLHHVEVMPVLAAVLVNRHRRRPSIGA